jgi:F-type H+-transporting ATPase subunit b
MKKVLPAAAFAVLLIAVPAGFAQEGESGSQQVATEEHGTMAGWLWANFLVLAGIGVYFWRKNAGPFFIARSKQIRRDLVEAADTHKEAEARVAEVERRLANLEADIAALRSESQQEARAEMERIRQHTAGEIAKIQEHAEREIATAGKAARTELKRYSARLALELAGQRIRERMTPETEEALAHNFVEELENTVSGVPVTEAAKQ